jgi:hypothetical protein
MGTGVGLDATVSPFVCTEDAVIGGGEPVFRADKKKGVNTPVERTKKMLTLAMDA